MIDILLAQIVHLRTFRTLFAFDGLEALLAASWVSGKLLMAVHQLL
jgi:hypothetical protein